ncbi:MAG: carbamoyltransferase HypF [Lachnospiraceae bacterium]|nr:carbamoyltransferase HypF [Lachnospiraceae bacterium]
MTAFRTIRIYGIVQGVGFRPTVKRLADEYSVAGSVRNAGAYVEIRARGEEEALKAFISDLQRRSPERSEILKFSVSPAKAFEADTFQITDSLSRPGEVYISPDIAICDDCARELFDRDNIRYLHPFINCTLCGPRFTILEHLPYDRERTSMKSFPMCPSCAQEYKNPASRRFDAQPVCCNNCGPGVYGFPGRAGAAGLPAEPEGGLLRDLAAIRKAREIIRRGGIVAVKGIGGFHLCCDAGNDGAVRLLRERKHRPAKPFALMSDNIDTVRSLCFVSDAEEAELTGHRKPIVLLKKRESAFPRALSISPAVAPDNPRLGVMLPYAPIHLLLFRYDETDDGGNGVVSGSGPARFPKALVMTSGNVSGAPIAKDDESAVSMLDDIADYFLSHDRPVLTRADDSVVIFSGERPYFIRRSRGYAPLPVIMENPPEVKDVPALSGLTAPGITGDILAVGGEFKNTFCIGKGNLLYPSAYIGDMEDERSVAALEESAERMITLLEADIKTVVCDLHPGYNTTHFAERFAGKKGAGLIRVQHHHAHILSCMAEYDLKGPVLGIALDGTGYGTDGTIWGGEILEADLKGFTRKAYLTPFRQPGGDAGAREGWRIASSLIRQTFPEAESAELSAALGLCEEAEFDMLRKSLLSGVNVRTSTSCGRLFDAVSAILGLKRESAFEGEAAMALQFAAERFERRDGKSGYGEAAAKAGVSAAGPVIDTPALIRRMAAGRLAGENTESLAFEFHDTLSALIAIKTLELGVESGIRTAVLSGGCFQNLLFLRLLSSKLEKRGFRVFTPRSLPANDNGLSLGQCFYGLAAERP